MNFTELAQLISITCYVIIFGTAIAVAPSAVLILRGLFRKIKRLFNPVRKVSEEQFDEVIEEIHENILEIENEFQQLLDEDDIKQLIDINSNKVIDQFNEALASYENRNRIRYENALKEIAQLALQKSKRKK